MSDFRRFPPVLSYSLPSQPQLAITKDIIRSEIFGLVILTIGNRIGCSSESTQSEDHKSHPYFQAGNTIWSDLNSLWRCLETDKIVREPFRISIFLHPIDSQHRILVGNVVRENYMTIGPSREARSNRVAQNCAQSRYNTRDLTSHGGPLSYHVFGTRDTENFF